MTPSLPQLARAALVLSLVSGCASPIPSSSISEPADSMSQSAAGSPSTQPSEQDATVSPPPMVTDDELPLSCGSPLAFSAGALLGQSGAESADHPAAEALRALIADSPLPKRSGWQIVVLTARHALFLLPATSDEGSAFWSAEFEQSNSEWLYVRSGQCDIRPALGNFEPARWDLEPGQTLGPETRSFTVLVTELGCASGQSPEGRIVPAAAIYQEDAVIVIFGTRPLSGAQTCISGPAAQASVMLHEPLGNRRLFDGSVIPPEPRS